MWPQSWSVKRGRTSIKLIYTLLFSCPGLPGGSDGKESSCSAGHRGSIPGSGRSWKREKLATPIFLPGNSHGQRSLMGYSPWGRKESDMSEQLTHTYYYPDPEGCWHFSFLNFLLKLFFKRCLNIYVKSLTAWLSSWKAEFVLTSYGIFSRVCTFLLVIYWLNNELRNQQIHEL